MKRPALLSCHGRPRFGAVALVAAVAALGSGCQGNKSKEPPVHPNQNMDFQQYYEAQEANPWFRDGRAMREPVAGTVARDLLLRKDDKFLRDDDLLYLGRGPDGRLVDALPRQIALTPALLDRGRDRFAIYCTPCHDGVGSGGGIVAQRGLPVKPPTYHQDRLRAMPLAYFYEVISKGRGTMPSYAAQVPVEDRWAIAAWVRTLQRSQAARAGDLPSATAAEKGGTP